MDLKVYGGFMKLLPILAMAAILSPSLMASADQDKALRMALDDEYKAEATYSQVMNDFGQVRPFSNIRRAEQRHIEALLPLFTKYGLEVPDNPYIGKVGFYDSVREACEAGVEAEIENVALYDQIDAMVEDSDVAFVFSRLRQASQDKHLPAFERCANR